MLFVLCRDISPAMEQCELTHIDRVPLSVAKCREQHKSYVAVFESMIRDGHKIRLVHAPALAQFPDSVFVEDVALCFPELVILTRPGAASRRDEVLHIESPLQSLYLDVQTPMPRLTDPACCDGGDVLVVGQWVFVGLSTRTNMEGVEQLSRILAPYSQYKVIPLRVKQSLHLKSAASMITEQCVLVNPAWVDETEFTRRGLSVIHVDPAEPHSANILSFVSVSPSQRIERTVVVPMAFPNLAQRLQPLVQSGVIHRCDVIDVSEIAKAEGALTCCSLLRFISSKATSMVLLSRM